MDGAGRDVIGQCEVSRQVSYKLRSMNIRRGWGIIVGGGGQSTSEPLKKINILEQKGRGRYVAGKLTSISNRDDNNISNIVQQFGGARGESLHTVIIFWKNLTPTKTRLIQNENTNLHINNFENAPLNSTPEEYVSESPAVVISPIMLSSSK